MYFLIAGLSLVCAGRAYAQDETFASLSEQLENSTNDSSRVDLLNKISFKHLDLNQLEKGVQVSNEAMILARTIKYQHGRADAYENLGIYHTYTNNFQEALNNYLSALHIFQGTDDSAHMAGALHRVGEMYFAKGSYDTALMYFHRSKEVKMAFTENITGANTCNMIGLIHYTRGQFEVALENFMESMQLCQAEGNSLDMSLTYSYIGMVNLKLSDFSQAEEYLYVALELNKKYGPTRDIIDMYIQLGFLFRATQRYNEAIQSIEKGLSLARFYNNQFKVAVSFNALGLVYHDQEDFKNALFYYYKALGIYNAHDMKHGTLVASANIARTYINLIEARKSRRYTDYSVAMVSEQEIFSLLDESIIMAKESGNFDDLVMAYETLVQASYIFNKFDDAIRYQEEFIHFKDSIGYINQNRSIAELQARFETGQKEQEIVLLNSEKKVQESSMRRHRIETYFFLGGGLTLIMLMFGLINRLKYMRRTRNELQTKNQQIEEEKLRAQQSEVVKEQFLAKMSHEIRIPMNTIMGSVNIILKNEHLQGQKKYLRAITQSSENLLVIINDILDLSKLEAGKIALEEGPFSILDEVMNVENILKFKAKEKGIRLISKMGDNLPECVVGDSTRLNQVLINLAGNGIKFTDKGTVTISVEVVDKLDDSIILRFSVEDTGIGIPEDRLDKIFRSFTQADSDTTRKYGGTGLGLTISKQLLELQNGKINVTSEPGKGSCFSFEITYAIGNMDVDREIFPDGLRADKLKGLKILIVEDDDFNVMVLSDTLSAALEEVEMEVAGDGNDALIKWNSRAFDVVLMDIELPGLNGHEVTRAIRQGGSPQSDIPIIAMTANAMLKEVEACYESGMNDYIAKPFDPDDLILKINSLLINQEKV